MSTSLKHFGVLGMRWGHRKFVTPEGTLNEKGAKKYTGSKLHKDLINSKDRTLREGTTIQNISNKELPATLRTGLYTSYTKFDNAVYDNIMGNFMYSRDAHKNTFLVKKDIRIPSDKKLVELFIKTAQENPKEVARDMTKVYNEMTIYFPKFEFMMRRKLSSLKLDQPESKEAQKLARDFLVDTIMSKKVSDARNKFFGTVLKEGYDAISDPNDRDAWAQDPLIIVNMGSIKGTGSVKLTGKDLDNYYYYTASKEHKARTKDLTEIQR